MHRQELAICEKVLRKGHPDTLMSMNNLAAVLSSQGKYEAAEAMQRQTLAMREEVLGKEHPSTLTSVYCLADLLANQRRFQEAAVLYERAMKGTTMSLDTITRLRAHFVNNIPKCLDHNHKNDMLFPQEFRR
jgi:tetratricopeptide (TPR) repeat protein